MVPTVTSPDTLSELIRAVLDDARTTRTFARGEAYHCGGAVSSLAWSEGSVRARVRGTKPYRVKLWIEDNRLGHSCTCPAWADSGFCKHCVAVGLAVLDGTDGSARAPEPPAVTKKDVCAHVAGMTKDALVGLVLEQAGRDDRLDERLRMTVAVSRAGGPDLATFRRAIDAAIDTGDFIPWDEAYDYAEGVREVVDRIEDLLKAGHAAAVIELSEHALAAAERQMESIDDSDGHMGEILGRLQELHLAACRKAKPDPETLARRLFAWEMRSDWEVFCDAAETYAGVLGRKGLVVYEALAEAEWAKVPALGPGEKDPRQHGRMFRITAMMEAVARQSGDVDRLVEVMGLDLSHGYGYLRIAEVLRHAKRREDAVSWAERGLAAFPDGPDGRLRLFLADEYHRAGRHADAVNLIWDEFEASPHLEGYQLLKKHAERDRSWPTWQEKALALLRERAEKETPAVRRSPWEWRRDASELVRVFLWEGDPDQAWAEAQAGGCSENLWMELAELREQDHPQDAVAVYRRLVDPTVNRKNNDAYRAGVALLRKASALVKRLGQEEAFRAYLAEVRLAHKPKRNFMKLLDRERWN